MKTLIYSDHRPNSVLLMAGSTVVMAALALTAMSFAGAAHARDNVTFSVGIGGPRVLVGATNAYPVYSQPRPVYVQPQPVYVQRAPVYYQPAPAYYSAQPVYAVPQVVYHGGPPGWNGRHHKHHKHHKHDGSGYYQQSPQGYGPGYGSGYGPGYGQVYYQR